MRVHASNVNSLTDRCVAAASLSVDNRPTIFRSTLLLHNIIRSFYKPEHRDEPSSAHFFFSLCRLFRSTLHDLKKEPLLSRWSLLTFAKECCIKYAAQISSWANWISQRTASNLQLASNCPPFPTPLPCWLDGGECDTYINFFVNRLPRSLISL